jgi:hypothetical protein
MKSWTPTDRAICQTCHFALASAGVWVFPACFKKPPWWGAIAVVAFAIPKELAFDILVELDDWGDSWEDLAAYLIGVLFALGVYYLFRRNDP